MASSRSAFITGINGFVGTYLAEHLLSQGWTVGGIDRQGSAAGRGYDYVQGDILATAEIAAILETRRPDRIFHLAAISMPSAVDQSPQPALSVNIMGTVSVLEAVRAAAPSARLLIVGSSKQYGRIEGSAPLTEEHPCRPTDLYGISKQAGETIGLEYAGLFGMDIRFARSFNHSGAGQPPAFVCSDWARQTAAIELGIADPVLRVGDLTSALDFCHVADVVRAYALILDKGKSAAVYNVCSGNAISLRGMLTLIVSKSSRPIAVVEDASRLRGHRAPAIIVGDRTKISRDTGWEPGVPIGKMVDDLYRYWIDVLSADVK
jgi:GDP-4-dehydro-6-deoxy-D-mannose reductase